MDDATQKDLAVYAKQSGSDLAAVRNKYRGLKTFEEVAAKLATDYAGTYVNAGYFESGQADVWVRFTREPEQSALDLLRNLPYDVQLQYGAPLNAADLEVISEEMFSAVAKYPGVATVVSETDPADDSITVTYRLSRGAAVDEALLRSTALSAGAARSVSKNIPVAVTFVNDPNLAVGSDSPGPRESPTALTSPSPGWAPSRSADQSVLTAGPSGGPRPAP
ncbi:hypothetical protein [Sphaerisporangium sp. NPDC051011]|uniref:hypothetical protein n=1 Tax=Sphaerisporangium sp. NPDC051011 TaxID=3155792 RepID=UPI0033D880C6